MEGQVKSSLFHITTIHDPFRSSIPLLSRMIHVFIPTISLTPNPDSQVPRHPRISEPRAISTAGQPNQTKPIILRLSRDSPSPPLPFQPLHQHRRLIPFLHSQTLPHPFPLPLLLLCSNRHPPVEKLNRIRVREPRDTPGGMARVEDCVDDCLRVAL